MTLSQLRNEISLIESEHEERLRSDVQEVEAQYLDQFKYINQGDPIVLDDEFLGYFDNIGFQYGMIEIGYTTEKGNGLTYASVLTENPEGLRIAQHDEVA